MSLREKAVGICFARSIVLIGVILLAVSPSQPAFGEVLHYNFPVSMGAPPALWSDAAFHFRDYPYGWTTMGTSFTIEDVNFESGGVCSVYVYHAPGILMLPIGDVVEISFGPNGTGYVEHFAFRMEGFGSEQPMEIRATELDGNVTIFQVAAETYSWRYHGLMSDQGMQKVEIAYLQQHGSIIAFDMFERTAVLPEPGTLCILGSMWACVFLRNRRCKAN